MNKGGLFLSIDNLLNLNSGQSSNIDLLVIELVRAAIVFQLADITEVAEFIVGYANGLKQSYKPNDIDIVSIGNGFWELLLNESTSLCSSISLTQAESAKLLAVRVFNS